MHRDPEKPGALQELLGSLLTDIRFLYLSEKAFSRDYSRAIARLRDEGIHFIVDCLPSLADSLLTGVECGYLPRNEYFRYRGGLPVFLREPISRVFSTSGALDAQLDATALAGLLQVLLFFKKMKGECPAHVRDADILDFLKRNQSLRADFHQLRGFGEVRRRFSQLLNRDYPDPSAFAHGPGATAEKHAPQDKWRLAGTTFTLERVLPLSSILPRGAAEQEVLLNSYRSMKERFSSRLVTVEKTSRKSRVIAIEPIVAMLYQQGLRRVLEPSIERITRGQISFSAGPDQQRIRALDGSRDGSYATIDLSAASDSISLNLVEALVDGTRLGPLLLACRSTHTLVGQEEIPLQMYATMGNATTFPLESYLFWSLARVITDEAYVFGDDIIVPSASAPEVISLLNDYGFEVNTTKTFYRGPFRESCGGWYVLGQDVTPTFLRERPKKDRVISTVETSNQLHKKGWWNSAHVLTRIVRDHYGYTVPAIPVGYRSLIGFETFASDVVRYDGPIRYNPSSSYVEGRMLTTQSNPAKRSNNWYGYSQALLGHAEDGPVATRERGHKIVFRWLPFA